MNPYNPYWSRQMMNFNPYQQQIFPAQMSGSLAGRIVDSFDSITADLVPMDNLGAVFIKSDGSEIQRRVWGNDGIIKITSYLAQNGVLNNKTDILSTEQEKSVLGGFDNVTIGDMKEKIDAIYSRMIEKDGAENESEHDVADGNAKAPAKRNATSK